MTGTLWFVAALLPFLFAQRWLHRQIQMLLYILTRSPQWVMGIFSLLFLPGVFVHEASHYLAARLLGVRARGFSLVPRMLPDGNMQLGAVTAEKADFFRDALIGAAPLIVGGGLVALIAVYPLRMLPLVDAASARNWDSLMVLLGATPRVPDFWLWLYLAFTISSTMTPSASDRRAWVPVFVLISALIGSVVLLGAGGWMSIYLAPYFEQGMASAALVLVFSLGIHLVLGLPLMLLVRIAVRLSGLRIA